MGVSRFYQGMPCDAELLGLARADKDIAETALFPLLLGTIPTSTLLRRVWREDSYRPLRDFCAQYPDFQDWHYDSSSKIPGGYRLIHSIDKGSSEYSQGSEVENEKTFGYKFVIGFEVFSKFFFSTTGQPVRISPPSFIKECAAYCQAIDRNLIPEDSREEFIDMADFYQMIASLDNFVVLVMQD